LEPQYNHGLLYRAKIVRSRGPTEYGDRLCSALRRRAGMRGLIRHFGTRYCCDAEQIGYSECEVDERTRVISTL
jgi:hypothetical protein